MDDSLKKTLLTDVAAPMLVPLARVGITQHYENKRLKRRENFQVRMAEHKNQRLQAVTEGESPESTEPFAGPGEDPINDDPEGEGDPLGEAVEMADGLDESIQRAKQETNCSFCQDILTDLQHEDIETQRQGLREIRELEAVRQSNPTREEIDQVMERFEVIPRLAV